MSLSDRQRSAPLLRELLLRQGSSVILQQSASNSLVPVVDGAAIRTVSGAHA